MRRFPERTEVALVGVGPIGLELAVASKRADTMETNAKGLYVADTATAGTQASYRVFLENCHVHTDPIVAALTGRPPPPDPTPLARPES